MKTFITLGIVLKISEDTIYQLEHVLDLIETYQEEITIMHPDEGDYNHWEEETILGKDIYQLIDKLANIIFKFFKILSRYFVIFSTTCY